MIIHPINLKISRIKIYILYFLVYLYILILVETVNKTGRDWYGGILGDVLLPSKLLPFLLKGPDPADSCHVNNLWEIGPNKNLSSRNKCSLSSETAINARGKQRLPDKVTSAGPRDSGITVTGDNNFTLSGMDHEADK